LPYHYITLADQYKGFYPFKTGYLRKKRH